MTITVQVPPDIERQIRKSVSLGEIDAVRHLLLEVLEAEVETLMSNNPQLSDDEFEALADQLADEFMVSVGPDCPPLSDYAVSREGLYEGHL
jgi:antitoxin ParD1/3/4